jgi:hypothetical protein
MMGMEFGSYFGSGLHWTGAGWHVWFGECDEPLSASKGPYSRDGFAFARSFAHVDVTASALSRCLQHDFAR